MGFIAVLVFIFARGPYYTSLKTNDVARFFIQVGASIAVIGSVVGFALGLSALFQIVLSKFKRKGVFRALLGLFLPVLTAGFVMPTMGTCDKYVYLLMTEKRILQFLNENNINADMRIERRVLFRNYGFTMEEHTKDNISFVTLRFELRYEHDNLDLPEFFEASIYKGLDRVECKVVDSIEE